MKTLGQLAESKPMYVVRTGQKLTEVVKVMAEHKVGAVPVLDKDDRLRGIFSERDLLTRCVASGLDLSKTNVDEVMTKKVILMEADDSYEECLRIMKQQSIRHIPVINGDKLVGMASMRDLMETDAHAKKEEIETLQSYIHYSPKGFEKQD